MPISEKYDYAIYVEKFSDQTEIFRCHPCIECNNIVDKEVCYAYRNGYFVGVVHRDCIQKRSGKE